MASLFIRGRGDVSMTKYSFAMTRPTCRRNGDSNPAIVGEPTRDGCSLLNSYGFNTRLLDRENCHERSKEHIRGPRSLSGYVSYQRRNAMPKSEVSRRASETKTGRRAALPGALEGQVEEICRDLSVQVKRMRQLHEQARVEDSASRVGMPGRSEFHLRTD